MKQSVTLKGSKDGYLLQLDDRAAYSTITEELHVLLANLRNEQVNPESEEESELQVTVQTGSRLLSSEEKETLVQEIEKVHLFKVKKFEANVIQIEDALKWHELNQTR